MSDFRELVEELKRRQKQEEEQEQKPVPDQEEFAA